MKGRVGFTVFFLCLLGFTLRWMIRESVRYAPPRYTVEPGSWERVDRTGPDLPEGPPLPAPAPRSRGLDPMWPAAAPAPPAVEDLRPAEDLAPAPPASGARPSPAEHYLSRVPGYPTPKGARLFVLQQQVLFLQRYLTERGADAGELLLLLARAQVDVLVCYFAADRR